MKICLIGNGLTNLVLAKILTSKKISVYLFSESKKEPYFKSRTIGISKNNYDYFINNIIDLKKISWPINSIEIYKESDIKNKIFNFNNQKQLFYIIKYENFVKLIKHNINKNKFLKKIKTNRIILNDLNKKYNFDLIINSDSNNEISKKFLYKKIIKNYKSKAYTCILKHKKIKNNNAMQVFTDFGPLAFLPISNFETSIVYSLLENKNYLSETKIKNLIIKYNKKYKIKEFSKFEKFNLKYLASRKYFYKNILSFGDNIHKVHPLAGQGFNMTIRDIKIISELIQSRLDLGLPLDNQVLQNFESITKHKNYIFSSGIDLIYEFFKFENKYGNKYINRMLNFLSKNKYFNKYALKLADNGMSFKTTE